MSKCVLKNRDDSRTHWPVNRLLSRGLIIAYGSSVGQMFVSAVVESNEGGRKKGRSSYINDEP